MIDLSKVGKIILHPGMTDMRKGINSLMYEAGKMEEHVLHIFCSKARSDIKIIEVTKDACWLYQKKLFNGKFSWPSEGVLSDITINELVYIIEGISLINRIENKINVMNCDLY